MFPASEKVLMLFIAYLHTQKISHGTIKSYLAAVRYGHIFRGLEDPRIHEMPQLEYILKGVKRSSPQCTRTIKASHHSRNSNGPEEGMAKGRQ